jgi:hypothetical protein
MKKRFVDNPNLLTIINPAEIVVNRIIGEGTFGRVWNANRRSADVAVKEFVFAQAVRHVSRVFHASGFSIL